MSDTRKDGRLQLVSLMFKASRIPRSGRIVDLILGRAVHGKVHLYVKVPEGDVAFEDSDFPLGQRPVRPSNKIKTVRRFEFTPINDGSAANDPIKDILSGPVHTAATYLGLGTWHAEALRAKRQAMLDTFTGGLMRHSNRKFAQDGWLVPCQITSSLRLCAAERCAMGVVRSACLSWDPIHQELSDSPSLIEPKDIFIDALIAAELDAPRNQRQHDPYRLRNGAYGVYLLYCAADNFYDLLVTEQLQLRDVELWVSSMEPNLYQQKTLTHHAVKLLSPSHRRGSGGGKADKGKVRPDVIAPEIFRPGCKRPDFVTDGLALLIVVALWWIDECNKGAAKPGAPKPGRDDVDRQLAEAGFKTKETPFLRDVIRWSHSPTSK